MAAAFAIIGIYILLNVFLMPITQADIVVAFAYCVVLQSFWLGLLVSTIVVFIGCYISAIICLLLGRYVFAGFFRRQLKRSNSPLGNKMKIVDKMFVENGILLTALLRLMFLPFGLVSYLLGVTSVSISDYMIGTLVYIFKTALLCSLGCTIYLATV